MCAYGLLSSAEMQPYDHVHFMSPITRPDLLLAAHLYNEATGGWLSGYAWGENIGWLTVTGVAC